jgi:5-carboxymethyl-2-hydroxymuconate isomerase
MHSITADFMDKNKTIYANVKAMNDTVAELKANNAIIAGKRDVQETVTDGQAEAARQARQDLEERILEIADQLYALAAKNNDTVLEAQSHWTLSLLDGLDPGKLEQTGKDIFALATANVAALADYNVMPAEVTALDTSRANFSQVKTALPTATAQQAGQTKTLPQAIRDNQTLLRKQLDRQMTKFKKTQPEFYAGYHAARLIISRRSHHKTAKTTTATPAAQSMPQSQPTASK